MNWLARGGTGSEDYCNIGDIRLKVSSLWRDIEFEGPPGIVFLPQGKRTRIHIRANLRRGDHVVPARGLGIWGRISESDSPLRVEGGQKQVTGIDGFHEFMVVSTSDYADNGRTHHLTISIDPEWYDFGGSRFGKIQDATMLRTLQSGLLAIPIQIGKKAQVEYDVNVGDYVEFAEIEALDDPVKASIRRVGLDISPVGSKTEFVWEVKLSIEKSASAGTWSGRGEVSCLRDGSQIGRFRVPEVSFRSKQKTCRSLVEDWMVQGGTRVLEDALHSIENRIANGDGFRP